MMKLATANQIRKADEIMIRERGFPGLLLMETAGRKAAARILAHYPDRSCYLILAGPGNNGGDGFVIARYLVLAGKAVKVVAVPGSQGYQGDALANLHAWTSGGYVVLSPEDFNAAGFPAGLPTDCLVIDALLGTGISGPLRGPVAGLISQFASRTQDCVAVDCPSGLDANTGFVLNTVIPAALTLTFQVPKLCHVVYPAAGLCGQVEVLDIGIWPPVLEQLGIGREVLNGDWGRTYLNLRKPEGHKGTYGHVLAIGGSTTMPGALAMTARAALHAGAGLSTAITPSNAHPAFFQVAGPEPMCLAAGHGDQLGPDAADDVLAALDRKAAVALGPGMGQHPDSVAFLEAILPAIKVPLVVDADGLNLIASHPALMAKLPAETVLTPHPGEMRRLFPGQFQMDQRLEGAEGFVREYPVVLVLKGAGTIVASPGGTESGWTGVNTTGNPGMGTAGSGDVLTGTIAGLLAQGYPARIAAGLGVLVHGMAGDRCAAARGEEGVTALELMRELGPAMQALRNGEATGPVAPQKSG